MSIKEMVKPGKSVYFDHYQNKELWYITDCGFEFPVPIDDTGAATFARQDKAMLFMRWIRKHLANIETAKVEQGV